MDYKKIVIAFILALTLQGCAAVVGGAAVGASTTIVVYDQRPIKIIMSDESTSHNIIKQLADHPNIAKQCHIVVSTYRGIVLIAGQAPNSELRGEVEDIAKSESKAKRLYNEITVQGPSSSLTRTSDAWITTKAKTELLGTKYLKSGQFKIVTENGTVFLMGLATRSQANLALHTIRRIDGVQRVVKMMEYRR